MGTSPPMLAQEYELVIPSKSLTVTENFTISFSESNNNILMMLAWDATVVPVLLQKK